MDTHGGTSLFHNANSNTISLYHGQLESRHTIREIWIYQVIKTINKASTINQKFAGYPWVPKLQSRTASAADFLILCKTET
jgi:hypothetical protein